MSKQVDRFIFADVLRIAATMAVISIHSVGQLFYLGLDSPSIDWWWAGNIFTCLSRWAVPIFLMLSGMLLLEPKKEFLSIKDFVSRRLLKILAPLIFWSVFYEIYNTVYINKSQVNALQILQNIYSGKVQYHLWFLYLITAIYLITPVIRIFIKNSKETEIKYCLFLWLIGNGIIQFLDGSTGLQNGFYFSNFCGYLCYYTLGYYLSKITLSKKQLQATVLAFCFSTSICALLNYCLIINGFQSKLDLFTSNLSLFTIINSISVFLIAKSIDWYSNLQCMKFELFITKAIESLSRSSFGMYLIHIQVLGLLSSKTLGLYISYRLIHPFIGIPITIISATITSYVFVQCLRKVKPMIYILPY